MIKLISWLYKPFVQWRWLTLSKLINERNYKTYVEVGVWNARNVTHILRLCPRLEKVYLIDPYERYIQGVKGETMSTATQEEHDDMYYWVKGKFDGDERVTLHRFSSSEAHGLFKPDSVDIVFLDHEHTFDAVKDGIEDWLPKIRNGGVLSGHNYEIKYFGVISAVNFKLGQDNVIIHPDSVWVFNV